MGMMQILRKKYDMGYLQPSWLGRRWQPWYQDLLQLAGVKGNCPCFLAASCTAKPAYTDWLNTLAPRPHARVSQDVKLQSSTAYKTAQGYAPLLCAFVFVC